MRPQDILLVIVGSITLELGARSLSSFDTGPKVLSMDSDGTRSTSPMILFYSDIESDYVHSIGEIGTGLRSHKCLVKS